MTKRKDGSGGIYHYVLILGLLAAAYGRFGTTNASNDTGFWWGFLVLNIVGLQMSCFGHLNPKIAAKIREGQGWGHSLGVKVLQTELALLQLCVLIASLYAQFWIKDLNMMRMLGCLWGLAMTFFGLVHLFHGDTSSLLGVAGVDMAYGIFLITLSSI